MKIAIICYQNVSYLEILSFLNPLESYKAEQLQRDLSWEFCSYLPMHNGKPGLSLTTSYVGLPLQGFDFIFLPNPRPGQSFPAEADWLQWVNTASNCPLLISQEMGKISIDLSNLKELKTVKSPASAADFILSTYDSPNGKTRPLSTPKTAETQPLSSRTALLERNSAETQISVNLNLDGQGNAQINTGIAFLDHMLSQIAKHGLFDLTLQAQGDLEIDPHHTMEDTGLALGEAFRIAAGDRKGIRRMSTATVAMDESLAEVTLDFSGRPYAVLSTQWTNPILAEIPTSLFEHFLESFASAARINLFVRVLAGKDNHHMSEAIFKALARALEDALRLDPRRSGMIPSTKEVLF